MNDSSSKPQEITLTPAVREALARQVAAISDAQRAELVKAGWTPPDAEVVVLDGGIPWPSARTSPKVQLPASRANRVYVAGPMTGLPEYNFPAFNAAAAMLRAQGLHVENPAEHGIVDGADWADYLHYDLARLATCSEIYLLPGWSKSRGAALEALCAHTLGMTITYGFGAERVELVDALQAIQSLVVWPAGLADRVEAALKRIEDGSCYRRIPADITDPDLVLAEVKALILGRRVPFWLEPKKPATAAAPALDAKTVYHGIDMAAGPEGCSISLTPAARDVLLERIRQVEEEGYDAQHDDEHVNDEIAAMAALFIMPEGARDWDATSTGYGDTLAQAMVPAQWYMPTFGDRRRDLVKGGALIQAEIERMDRAKAAG